MESLIVFLFFKKNSVVFKACITCFLLIREKFGQSYSTQRLAQGTSKSKKQSKEARRQIELIKDKGTRTRRRKPNRAATDTKPVGAHRRASSKMALARATGCKVTRSWKRWFLSFLSDQVLTVNFRQLRHEFTFNVGIDLLF
jgi:hypothetical protein